MKGTFGICQGVLKNGDNRPRTNGESWKNIFVFLMNICHVLFDIKAGINLPGLYALFNWRSRSRGYVSLYLGFLKIYLIFYKYLFFYDIKIKCLKIFFICVFITHHRWYIPTSTRREWYRSGKDYTHTIATRSSWRSCPILIHTPTLASRADWLNKKSVLQGCSLCLLWVISQKEEIARGHNRPCPQKHRPLWPTGDIWLCMTCLLVAQYGPQHWDILQLM